MPCPSLPITIANGISAAISLKIPMVGHVNSLNASVAASLMMYEVYRKRHQVGD
jgi:tRNA G18 (ribose-2'-O)-methylase SpoU